MKIYAHIAIFTAMLFLAGLYDPPNGCAQGAPGTPACDFSAINNSLYSTESSSAGGYTAVNNRTGAAGRYQFMPATRETYIQRNPQCNGQNCRSTQQWISQPCHAVQECIMSAFTNDNLTQIRRDPACQQLLANGGQTVTGTGQGRTLTCQVTESGLIAAFHLGGWDECRNILANGRGDNDGAGGRGGTDVSYYVCRHAGLAVPGNCAPSPVTVTPGTGIGSTGTQAQMDFSGGLDLSGPLDALRSWWVASLMLMAEQFTASMAAQVEAIGLMFDAKHQLETQRLFQEKTAEAHRDYQPSEQMCTFGTFARDLLATERSVNLSRDVIAEKLLQKEVRRGENFAYSQDSMDLSRIAVFRTRFCDQNDNGTGLRLLCPNPAPVHMRNRDINYTQTVDRPLSLNIDMLNAENTEDERAVFALVDNLFATDGIPIAPENTIELRRYNNNYLNLRSITAMRGIARNSVANIVAMKTVTPNRDNNTNAPYLRALLREFGLSTQEITDHLGENPSYYAQMEFLTRKMYQNPIFYTNLYDKPANVQRIRAAMKAIKLMQDRDIHSALQRREMLLSMLLEIRLRNTAEDAYDALEKGMFSVGVTSNRSGQTAPDPNTP